MIKYCTISHLKHDPNLNKSSSNASREWFAFRHLLFNSEISLLLFLPCTPIGGLELVKQICLIRLNVADTSFARPPSKFCLPITNAFNGLFIRWICAINITVACQVRKDWRQLSSRLKDFRVEWWWEDDRKEVEAITGRK